MNLRGELVGLTTTVATIAGHEQPAGYAIPIDEPTRRIIDTLKQGREVEYGLLGIGFQPRNPEALVASPVGATVQQVYPASPAAHAGFQPATSSLASLGRRSPTLTNCNWPSADSLPRSK